METWFSSSLEEPGNNELAHHENLSQNGWSKSKCTFLQLKSGWNERRPVLPSSSNLQPASIMKRLTGTLEAREFCSHRSCKDFTKSVSVSHLISTFLSYAFHVPTITLHINGHQRVFPLKLDHCCNFILGPDKDWAKARSQVWHKAGSTLSSFQLRFHVKAIVNLRQGTELIVFSWCFYVIVAFELYNSCSICCSFKCMFACSVWYLRTIEAQILERSGVSHQRLRTEEAIWKHLKSLCVKILTWRLWAKLRPYSCMLDMIIEQIPYANKLETWAPTCSNAGMTQLSRQKWALQSSRQLLGQWPAEAPHI